MTIGWLKHLKSFTLLLLFSIFTLSALMADAKAQEAKKQYVSDEIVITLRQGKGNEFKIIKMLRTGTPLKILEESDPYLKVRTEEGLEGWVLKKYLTPETPKRTIIAELENERNQLKTLLNQCSGDKDSLQDGLKTAKSGLADKISDLNQSLSASRKDAAETAKELERVTERYNTLLEQSKNVVQLVNEHDQQKALNERLKIEAEGLQKENSRLKNLQILWWFLAGGGVFFVGWMMGRVSRKKKYYS